MSGSSGQAATLLTWRQTLDTGCWEWVQPVEMLKSGTTTFLEAGTIRFLDEVVDGLQEVGIRGRVGQWVWDLPLEPDVYKQDTDQAVANLQRQLEHHPAASGNRISAWSLLVGHTTCSDPLWRTARELATEHSVGLSFHMSPAKLDPEGFVDGNKVVVNGRMTTIDEQALYSQSQLAGEAITTRSGLPDKAKWPVL